MKYSIVACAITGALAINTNVVVPRDASTITSILSDVKKNLESLDSAVKSYSGDKSALLKASNDLVSVLKDGKTKVDGSAELELNDAVTLTGPVQDLSKSADALVADLKNFRATVEKEGECVLVRTQVGNVNDASQALLKAVVSKVPQEAQQIASQLSAPLTKDLQDSVDAFSEENCKDSGNGGGSPTGSTPSSSAAGSSSAAPTGSASSPATPAPQPSKSSSAAGTVSASSSSGPVSTGPPVVTAGAAAIAPLGIAGIAAAALLL